MRSFSFYVTTGYACTRCTRVNHRCAQRTSFSPYRVGLRPPARSSVLTAVQTSSPPSWLIMTWANEESTCERARTGARARHARSAKYDARDQTKQIYSERVPQGSRSAQCKLTRVGLGEAEKGSWSKGVPSAGREWEKRRHCPTVRTK